MQRPLTVPRRLLQCSPRGTACGLRSWHAVCSGMMTADSQTRPDRQIRVRWSTGHCTDGDSAVQCSAAASRCHHCIRSATLSLCSPLPSLCLCVAISVAAGTASHSSAVVRRCPSVRRVPFCSLITQPPSKPTHTHTPLSLAHLVELIDASKSQLRRRRR